VGDRTSIAWTDHTFNPWWGCEKVSEACKFCYAEREAHRFGHQVWGKGADRRTFSTKHWMRPHAWDIAAKAAGVRRRVFCASMADVFEAREDLDGERRKLWDLIESTSGLDWLLLTKRPENIGRMVPADWLRQPRPNVWYGTTVENQATADKRIPELLMLPGPVRFLSCEPLLEPINLFEYLTPVRPRRIDWVIAGGESGPRPRLLDQAWIEDLMEQARAGGAAMFVKQLGTAYARKYQLTDTKAAAAWEWPGHLRVQEFPKPETGKEIAR
jgi:protein gp37